MKKLLCAVLLGALTLVPSLAQTGYNPAPEAKKIITLGVVGTQGGVYLCSMQEVGVKTGTVYRSWIASVSTLKTGWCDTLTSK